MGKLRRHDMEMDQRLGLALPASYYLEARLKWFEDYKNQLRKEKIKFDTTPDGFIRVQHRDGRWREFDTTEAQRVPVPVIIGMIQQWVAGKLEEDNIYRLLSPAEQIRVSNKVGRKPVKDQQDVQKYIDREFKKRSDLRRQGFDPLQEGLD